MSKENTWRLERISGRLYDVWKVIYEGNEATAKQRFSEAYRTIGEATLRLYCGDRLYGTANKAGGHLCGSEQPLRGNNLEDDN